MKKKEETEEEGMVGGRLTGRSKTGGKGGWDEDVTADARDDRGGERRAVARKDRTRRRLHSQCDELRAE